MPHKYQESDLIDSIDTVSTITCTKCGEEQELREDTMEAVEYFFSEGWRATRTNTYCPNCVHVYLKSFTKSKSKKK